MCKTTRPTDRHWKTWERETGNSVVTRCARNVWGSYENGEIPKMQNKAAEFAVD
jgi:hypothetical protein